MGKLGVVHKQDRKKRKRDENRVGRKVIEAEKKGLKFPANNGKVVKKEREVEYRGEERKAWHWVGMGKQE